MPRLRFVLLSLLIGCMLSGPSLAQWKWRDANGRVQYSDMPPPAGIADAQILQRPNATPRKPTTLPPAATAPGVAAAASAPLLPAAPAVEPELEAMRRQAEQDKAATQRAEDGKRAAAQADNCNRAKSHLRAIDDGTRLTRVNTKGERETLDDKARADEAARTRAIISADCR